MQRQEPVRRGDRNRTATVRTEPDQPSTRRRRKEKSNQTQKENTNEPKRKKPKMDEQRQTTTNQIQTQHYDYSSSAESDDGSENSLETCENFQFPPNKQMQFDQTVHQPRRKRMKKRGHQMQYSFNNRILRYVESALSSVVTKPLEAQAALIEARKDIEYRQKIIWIADQKGWEVVKEYESSGFGENEADEKKIKKAISIVERKRGAALGQQLSYPRQPLQPFQRAGSTAQTPFIPSLFAARPQNIQFQRRIFGNPKINPGTEFGPTGGKFSIKDRKLHSTCYSCGLVGHWSGDPVCKGGQLQGYF